MSNQASSITEGKTPESVTPGSVTIKEAAEVYLESLVAGGTRPGTLQVYGKSLDLAIQHFGADRKLSSILVAHTGKYFVSSLLNVLPSGRPKAEPTIKQNKRVFRQMMEYAQSQGFISNIPIPKAELQHARQKASQPVVEAAKPVEAEAPTEAKPQE